MAGFIGYKLDFVEFTCVTCGKVALCKSRKRKYCDDCRYQRHLDAQRTSAKNICEQNKAALAEVVKPTLNVEKPKYTLSEVNEAARKNRMTYGNYVYQWSIGAVEPPEKLPKKRGRKKNDRS